MEEAKMKILKMLEEGKITAEEAIRLLEALEGPRRWEPPSGQWFRVTVTDLRTGKQKVNITLPLGLVNFSFSIGSRFFPRWEEIWEKVKIGARGKIVDLEDEEEGEKVEIYIE